MLFLHEFGEPFSKNRLTDLVKRYVRAAGIGSGACHLFRHAMATHMLNNGADIRFIQAILGHAQLSTTEIYTHVTIAKLKEIHALTHPAERAVAAAPRRIEHLTDEHALLAALVAEDRLIPRPTRTIRPNTFDGRSPPSPADGGLEGGHSNITPRHYAQRGCRHVVRLPPE